MKTFKKAFALILTLAIVMSLGITAFAANTKTIVIKNNKDNTHVSISGQTFNAYKVFNLTTDKGDETSTKFEYTVNPAYAELSFDGKSGNELITYISTLTGNAAKLEAFANAVVALGVDPAATVQGAAAETATFADLEEGYYVIAGTAMNGNQVVTASCVVDNALEANQEIDLKVEAPVLDKTTSKTTAGSNVSGATAAIGEEVPFVLTADVPNTYNFEHYQFGFKDELTTGLSYVADKTAMTAKIGEQDLVIDLNNDKTVGANVFVTISGQKMTVTFGTAVRGVDNAKDALGLFTGHGTDQIVFTYKAKVLGTAANTTSEKNDAYVEYSNDPSDWTKHTGTDVPHDDVDVYDFSINVLKTDDTEDATPLEGAEFLMYRLVDGVKEYYQYDTSASKVVWHTTKEQDAEGVAAVKAKATKRTTAANGKLDAAFLGLEAGTYFLEEVKAPAGCHLLTNAVSVVITPTINPTTGALTKVVFTYENKDITANKGTIEQTSFSGQISAEVPVMNTSGSKLPETGGMGTTIFYTVGAIMMVSALVLLITKKKMSV